MNSDSVLIVTLCGFLGSGKTTLLRRWRRDKTLKDAPVIVHDLSEFGLDAELLSDENSTATTAPPSTAFARKWLAPKKDYAISFKPSSPAPPSAKTSSP